MYRERYGILLLPIVIAALNFQPQNTGNVYLIFIENYRVKEKKLLHTHHTPEYITAEY